MESVYDDVLGLTGSIGSGKSSVAGLLRQAGLQVIDADQIAKDVLQPNAPHFLEIIRDLEKQFKEELAVEGLEGIQTAGGELNRPALAAVAFKSQNSVKKLNQVVHPFVQQEFKAQKERLQPSKLPIVYDVPLLFETGNQNKFLKTILVYAPEPTCIQRAALRLGISEAQVQERMRLQISIEKKKELADIIVDNSLNFSHLEVQVTKLLEQLNRLFGTNNETINRT